jgi:hypothetical protein
VTEEDLAPKNNEKGRKKLKCVRIPIAIPLNAPFFTQKKRKKVWSIVRDTSTPYSNVNVKLLAPKITDLLRKDETKLCTTTDRSLSRPI